MFDLHSIMDLLRVEPGHGFVQSMILLGIWWQARGVKQEIASLGSGLAKIKVDTDQKFQQHESRITKLEVIEESK